jgi:hypothetical protein
MRFDDEQKALLGPLREAGAVVHFPFFANTFPLGYHYYSLAPAGVVLQNWALEAIPNDVQMIFNTKNLTEPHVFYATQESMSDFQVRLKQEDSPYLFQSVFYTEYIPRFFFFHTTRHVYLRDLIEHLCKDRQLNISFINELRNKFDLIEIFTDIPKQARLLRAQLNNLGISEKSISVIETWQNIFTFPNSAKKVLRIYFYAAPVSAALKKRETEFTYLYFPEQKDKSELNTHVCAITPKGLNGQTKRNIEQTRHGLTKIIRSLSRYHHNLLQAASESSMKLRDIWWTYNRYALSKQHNSLFSSPQEYASCLWDHHRSKAKRATAVKS